MTSLRARISVSSDFISKTLKARRHWNMFKGLLGGDCQPGILWPVRVSFRSGGGADALSDGGGLAEFAAGEPAMQEMLKEVLTAESK